ncbi:nitrate ABC transporter substrate-binding protein [Acidihalobacter ferrooxydans]|uniref:Nitrate ABC transporter substrate-binding protein n=2 Tax=Acidihalobacter ferrooxydans TaxID=1765967 RepID=A0A1P8ULA6_9GAMM|nr:nitrate ABC transporter substrate-binding protein [Acidihalobacter ferrooxydans]
MGAAQAATKVTFCTNWFAEAEHGGFYQAKATGLYKKAGLDVTIKMGGPQINGIQLLAAGQCDFYMGYPMQTIMAVYHGLPVVSVAASFQKDPQVIIAHQGVKSLASLKGKPILVSQSAYTTWWPWLENKYGFTQSQTRPYTFSVAPFLHDKNISQQGYIGSEPFMIEKGGEKPVIFLLADYGWPAYAETIVARTSMVKDEPKVVAAFVKASMEGWKSYLADPAPGNKLIKQADPKQTAAQMAFALKMMKKYKLVTGDEAAREGIGIMTAARWKKMFDFMVANKMLPASFDYKKAYDLQFIKGLDIKPASGQ